jgi:hypothetical protein
MIITAIILTQTIMPTQTPTIAATMIITPAPTIAAGILQHSPRLP